MKFTLAFSTLALAASASRCRFDRYITNTPGECKYRIKEGDQTERDACSNTHVNSCYGRPQDTSGDANCRLAVTAGSGCDPNKGILAEIPCTGNGLAWCPKSIAIESYAIKGQHRSTLPVIL
ncbi:hypothetical protein F5B21DRAFT_103898 [Xylaria acuta]|nr:hypothetical protein F5B21DRAFT_103898 [Xylaria acuta]